MACQCQDAGRTPEYLCPENGLHAGHQTTGVLCWRLALYVGEGLVLMAEVLERFAPTYP